MTPNATPIFVVDDDKFHLEIMQRILQLQGYSNIYLFSNGLDCLNQLHLQPETIFLDHQMDVYSGYEILRKIKRYNPNIYVVMVSAQEDINTAVATLKHGAFDYITKDENLDDNVKKVLKNIDEIKEILHQRKPNLIKKLFKYL